MTTYQIDVRNKDIYKLIAESDNATKSAPTDVLKTNTAHKNTTVNQ